RSQKAVPPSWKHCFLVKGEGLSLDWNQGDLAAVINIRDFYLNLIADVDNVFDLFNSLIATEVGDVNEPVTTWRDGDKGAESDCLHNSAQETLADLRKLRVRNGIDLFNGCICGFTGSSGDIDGAVVFDRHICAGFFRDGVDGLALRANQLTDLGYWNLDRGDLRCQWRHLIWSVNALGHDVQDLFAGIACLRQSISQYLGWDAIQLGIQLQCGDVVAGTRDLEVHIAECVFCTQDIGQSDEALFTVDLAGDKTHRNTSNRCLQRDASVVQRHRRSTDRTHGSRTIGSKSLRDLANGVRELLAWRDDRQQRTLCECTVANLAALWRTNTTGFTGGVWREVVVVYITLRLQWNQRVNGLLHLEHNQGGHTKNLGFTALKLRRDMYAWHQTNLSAQVTDIFSRTTIDKETFGEDLLTHDFLHQLVVSSADLLGRII